MPVIFYLINIDEMLKYLLTQREKGGCWSSLMDGPGAQAALHRTTAVQSRKSTESKEMCIHSQNLHTSSGCISSNLKAMLKHRDSAFRGDLQPLGSCPQPCRGGTWLQPSQLSHTCWTCLLCLHTKVGVQHIPHTPEAGHVTQIPVVTTNGASRGE